MGERRGMLSPLPMEGRATILPFRDSLPGSVMNEREWAVPGMLAGAYNAFIAPERVRQGMLDPSSEEAMMEALNVAGYPMLAGAPATAGARAMPSGMLGVNVFHGSPHRFDRLDASKIGTGEGAQVYGHGLYVAENPKVGQTYAKATAYKDAARNFRKELPDDADFDELLTLAAQGGLDPKVARVVRELADNDWLGFDYPAQAITAAFKDLKNFSDVTPGLQKAISEYGHLYKIDLPDEMVPRMLDWDKPLGQQPEAIQNALRDLVQDGPLRLEHGGSVSLAGGGSLKAYADPDFGMKYLLEIGDSTFKVTAKDAERLIGTGVEGKSVYQLLKSRLGSDADASAFLRARGIPGIRYLDQGSRTSGKGTYNYVVFPGEESALKILGRE
jgi:hypothetical protein